MEDVPRSSGLCNYLHWNVDFDITCNSAEELADLMVKQDMIWENEKRLELPSLGDNEGHPSTRDQGGAFTIIYAANNPTRYDVLRTKMGWYCIISIPDVQHERPRRNNSVPIENR